MTSITIVGASLAGLRGAEALRRDGFEGTITMIGDEPYRPYDRPPLSKQVLGGDWPVERLALATEEKLAELDLEWMLGRRAESLDLENRRVVLDDGTKVDGDGVLIATGARCRSLPGTDDLGGVYTLRNLDDSLAIEAEFARTPKRVVVVGAGFIGAEVAASARERGLEVTMVEAASVPLGRALGDDMGAVCAEVHREHGVDLRLEVGVEACHGTERVEAVELSDGSTIEADVVVVGIGVIPNTEWLESSGVTIDNGIVCDETCLAAPGISAAGDVARWPNLHFGEMMRVEHWDNAVEQGMHAARRLLQSTEEAEAFTPVPWFWSDQYDRKIQLAGRARGDDDFEIVTGTVEERRFAGIYGREGRVVGVLGFNRPRHVMQYRQLIASKATWEEALEFSQQS